eukprot:scaffold57743_cov50-Cyclotella_meneghiniana.AAC.2
MRSKAPYAIVATGDRPEMKRVLPCPIDIHVIPNDDDIIEKLVTTTRIISDRFKLSTANIGSRRFFAAIAVDAWFNEDYPYVRKFLLKSIILQHLQRGNESIEGS